MALPDSPFTPIYICTNLGVFLVAFDGISAVNPSPVPKGKRIQKQWQMRDGRGECGRRVFAPRGSSVGQRDFNFSASMIDPDDHELLQTSFDSIPGTIIIATSNPSSPVHKKYHCIWADDGYDPDTDEELGYLYYKSRIHAHVLGLSTVTLTGMPTDGSGS